jgi:Sec-independent protein translocase protein TatA
MFGLTFEKLLLIGIIAVFLLGPERLPGYTAKLAQFVRSLRDMANGAKSRMRDEMGPEFDDVDWKKLDPRQYDPRRIIREALLDDGPADGGAATTSSVTPPNRPRPEPAYLQHKAKSAGGPVPVDLPGDAGGAGGVGGAGGAAAVGVVGVAGAAAGGASGSGSGGSGSGSAEGVVADDAGGAPRPVATAYDSEAT